MCDNSYSLWPISITCSTAFGTCIDGGCQCKEGFQHDLASLRLRDCRLPNLYLPIVEGIFLATTAVSFVYSMYHVRTAKNLAGRIVQSCVASQAASLLLGIVRFSQKHQMSGGSFFLFYTNMSLSFLCAYLSVYSMAVPLCKMSQTPVKNVELPLKISFVAFRIVDAIPMILAWALYDDVNDPTKDYGWNMCSAVESLFYGIEMVGINAVIYIYGKKMVKAVESIMKEVESINSSSTIGYLNRVKGYLGMLFNFSILIVVMAFLEPVIFLSSNYLPYTFVLYSSSELCIPYFALQQTRFTVLSKENQSSRDPSRTISSGGDQSNLKGVSVVAPKDTPNTYQ